MKEKRLGPQWAQNTPQGALQQVRPGPEHPKKELLGICRARPPELPGQVKVLARHLPERKTPLSVTQRLFQEKRVTPNRKSRGSDVGWQEERSGYGSGGELGSRGNKERIQAEPFLYVHPSLGAAPVERDKPLSQLGICDSWPGHAPSGGIFKYLRVETTAENNPTEWCFRILTRY